MSDTYFTVLFEGDVRKLSGNPFRVESAFGKPVTIGRGDEFERRDLLEQALQEIAACECTNTAGRCKPPTTCPTCIARKALDAEGRTGQ